MAGWRGQSWNPAAAATALRVLRRPSLAVPHVAVPHIGHLDFAALRERGVRGIVFDKDNTLTAPYVDAVHPTVAEALDRCREAFKGRMCILSNSAGTPDDARFESAVAIENALDIPVIRHAEKKPGGMTEVLQHFRSCCGADVRSEELCVVGDRLLTDVVFGNLHGCLTVHTDVLTLVGDNAMARCIRPLEGLLFLRVLHRCLGLRPPPHPLMDAARAALKP
eukprot:EG_transcript_25585